MKYVIIDVYALAYRAFYGYPELNNKNGDPTQVIVGFFKQFYSRVRNPEQYYQTSFLWQHTYDYIQRP